MADLSSTLAGSPVLVSSHGGAMRRTRFQYGSIIRESRKRTPNVWVYRFYDYTGAHKKVLIGTVDKYPTKAAANKAAERFRAIANPDDPRVSQLATVIEHYIREELPERASTRTFICRGSTTTFNRSGGPTRCNAFSRSRLSNGSSNSSWHPRAKLT